MFDWNTPQEGAKAVECHNFTSYGTKEFAPHGISIFPHRGKNSHFVSLLAMPWEHVSVIREQGLLFDAMFWLLSPEFKALRDFIGPAKPIAWLVVFYKL